MPRGSCQASAVGGSGAWCQGSDERERRKTAACRDSSSRSAAALSHAAGSGRREHADACWTLRVVPHARRTGERSCRAHSLSNTTSLAKSGVAFIVCCFREVFIPVNNIILSWHAKLSLVRSASRGRSRARRRPVRVGPPALSVPESNDVRPSQEEKQPLQACYHRHRNSQQPRW